MLRVTRFLVVIVLYLSLSVLVSSQSTPSSVPDPEVIYGATSVEWPAFVPDAGALLTISGPAGFYLRQENPAGTWGRFSLVNEQGQLRPDGVYKWEVVSQAGREVEQTNQVQSGWFEIQSGRVVAEGIGGIGFGLIGGSQPLGGTEGSDNNLFGTGAGASITNGTRDSFFGAYAGYSNTSGSYNSFFGANVGSTNQTGNMNSFFGYWTGLSNAAGSGNSFFGAHTGESNTTGNENSFFGLRAGYSNTVESDNTLIGSRADLRGVMPGASPVTNATAIGYRAYVSEPNSLVLGSIAGVNSATSYVNVGIGTTAPARQLHLAGPNAVFRMDRSTDTASFIMVRTDPTGATPWKTFVVGTNATGVNQGEFIINDIGTAVGGGGNRRMTISNDGNVQFTGTVTSTGFLYPSSLALKMNVRTIEQALEMVNRLRGVRFDWKDSGKAAVGLIAEEVEEVVPEVVAHEKGKARGVNYANLVAVLVEAVKEQQAKIEEQEARIDRLERLLAER